MAIADETGDLINPAYVQDLCYTAQDMRRINGSLVCVEGVIGDGSLFVTESAVPAKSVDIAVGGAWIENDQDDAPLGDEGPYFVFNPEIQTLEIAANTSGSIRQDTILVRVCDAQYAPVASAFTIVVNEGTPGAGPPAAPSDGCTYYTLATVTLANGYSTVTNANILDTRELYELCTVQGPNVSLEADAVTSISNGAGGTKVVFGQQLHTDPDYFTILSSVVTVTESGVYDIDGMAEIATAAARVEIGISKNGLYTAGVILTELAYERAGTPGSTRTGGSFSRSNVFLNAGDTLQVYGFQNGAGSANTRDSASFHAFFNVRKVG